MCNSANDAGHFGESEVKSIVNKTRYEYRHKGHKISTLHADVEGEPFDIAIRIDGQTYYGQTKTTEHLTEKGSMKFNTRKNNGQPYNPDEIDFFIFYCIETQWCGIGLLSDCPKTGIEIWPSYKKNEKSRKKNEKLHIIDQFDYQNRIRELIENKCITSVDGTKKRKFNGLFEIIPEQFDTGEHIFEVLASCSYDWSAMAIEYEIDNFKLPIYQKLVNDWIMQKSA